MSVDLSKVYGLVAVHKFGDSQFQAIENMSQHMPHVVLPVAHWLILDLAHVRDERDVLLAKPFGSEPIYHETFSLLFQGILPECWISVYWIERHQERTARNKHIKFFFLSRGRNVVGLATWTGHLHLSFEAPAGWCAT